MLQLVATCSLQPWRRMHIVPPSARSKVSRCSAALCMLGRCSTPSQVLGAVGRCIRLGAGASCTIRKHSACSHRPPRTALHMHPPTPAEHMQCELRKCAFNSSEQHDRHAIQPTEHLPTTCRQPPCCSRCSVLAAAMTPHAHQCRPEGTCSGACIGTLPCSQATEASTSWSGDPSPWLLCSFG